MEYSILRYTNSIAKLAERDHRGEEPDIPNPLPVPPPAKLAIILDTIDEIEGELVSAAYKEKIGAFDSSKPHLWGQIAHEVRRNIGKVQQVPINKLIAIEPKLYGAHLTKLAQGYTPTRGDKLPIIYVLNSGMYVGDGNHRVVNELSKGKSSVEAVVIDFRQQEKELQ
jgi:hypothetical protein